VKRDKSPCIDVCDFSGAHGWCLGCARTRQECRDWKSMKPYSRNILLTELKKRMSAIKKDLAKASSRPSSRKTRRNG
jgi:predicted Fe-S protein YdhL (DUF1289 family)